MWQKLKNLTSSVQTYAELSPDLALRQQVNHRLQPRPSLDLELWIEQFWRPRGIAQPLAAFLYTHLSQYSGIDFARVQPQDHLHQDLHFLSVCWFDWELQLCEDFYQQFEVDLTEHLDELAGMDTVEDFAILLQNQL